MKGALASQMIARGKKPAGAGCLTVLGTWIETQEKFGDTQLNSTKFPLGYLVSITGIE